MALSALTKLNYPIEIAGQGSLRFAGHFFPAQADKRGVLQVLVHGNSYDHRYWNAETVNGQDYSYAAYMTGQGFDVLAIDLPGVGESDRPEGHSVSLQAVGSAISDLVASLKKPDTIPGHKFDHVALVGHSMGASISVYAEARWPSADSLIVTATGFFPDRPRSAWAPGVREALLGDPYALVPQPGRLKFYHAPQADPDVISYDNTVLRTPIPSGLWSDCIALQDDPKAGFADVTCPIFIQLGEHDPILPARYAEEERAIYSSASDTTVDAIPDIGHSFNLHLNRQRSWTGIKDFLLGQTGRL
ncbi:alpha/beta fold hydrolase [Pseudarthrobacter oxydans]|uniref:alpha/beta hydrolase n=1 Tax=Pseudarthrobacter oxydans TaxID=1671 RepID=UPI002AA71375|nr:alpha/beta fold hydrolase [Pseudarthrobacter oxydans]WPU09499.1 alpha/beta fold hydrolase [Pseudarthrobacter oxydans]